jgi:UDP-N-acetylmuramate dehydrogenase
VTPQTDVALAPFSTMAVGGPARWFVEARTDADVVEALRWAHARNVEVHVLGGGSNVVIADQGFNGLVLRVSIRGVESALADGRRVYRAGAGEPWDDFMTRAVDDEAAGLECLSGIPGLVGGTPVQNVGAYGQEVSGAITRVHAIERATATPVSFSSAECGFGYRTSRFKHADAGRYVVTRVEFSLTAHGAPTIVYGDVVAFFETAGIDAPTLRQVRAAILAIRRRKGMVIEEGNPVNRSCGSFFVNPVVSRAQLDRVQSMAGAGAVPHFVVDAQSVKIPAAWLIERAGFPRGTCRGPVGISPFQAQAIVNLGTAHAADVLALACEIKRAVWRTFGIALAPEPVFVGFAGSADWQWLRSDGPMTDEGR